MNRRTRNHSEIDLALETAAAAPTAEPVALTSQPEAGFRHRQATLRYRIAPTFVSLYLVTPTGEVFLGRVGDDRPEDYHATIDTLRLPTYASAGRGENG